MDEYAKIFESPSSAKDLLDYSKQSFSMFTAADAAFDSWLGSIEGKNLSRQMILNGQINCSTGYL